MTKVMADLADRWPTDGGNGKDGGSDKDDRDRRDNIDDGDGRDNGDDRNGRDVDGRWWRNTATVKMT